MMKRILLVAAALSALTMFNTTALAQGNSQVVRGHHIAPVPLNLSGLNPALVGLGSYIVNAQGGCNDCHTSPSYAPGGDPFMGQEEVVNVAGYLAGGAQFGPFTSRNLTPRAFNPKFPQ